MANILLKEKNKVKRQTLLNFKTHYKAIMITNQCCIGKKEKTNKSMKQNRKPKSNTYKYSQTVPG